jgi:hypothetical protein
MPKVVRKIKIVGSGAFIFTTHTHTKKKKKERVGSKKMLHS